MKAHSEFLNEDKNFWAYVRLISQEAGYTKHKKIKIPTEDNILEILEKFDLHDKKLFSKSQAINTFKKRLTNYFTQRANDLNNFVEPLLMDSDEAKLNFEKLYNLKEYKCKIPMNKQKGEKKNFAYFTGIINMIIENNINHMPCDFDPRRLTIFTKKVV